MINSLRGMNDILEEDYERFTYFINTATSVAQKYGFHFIETPLLEETALFKRSVGESSDIVGKEMYQFIDKGENDVCLRPEGTAGVVRAFIQKAPFHSCRKTRSSTSFQSRFFYLIGNLIRREVF